MMRSTLSRNPREMIIFALDESKSIEDAMSWVECLKDHVGMFKVGKESYILYGPRIVEGIRGRGGKVFLDLKFHDIPNTAAAAASAAVKLGVSMFNIHALGGKSMMAETVSAVKKTVQDCNLPMPVVLAVTVLTSLNDTDLKGLGFQYPGGELASHLAKIAKEAGIPGVVASAQDIENIRRSCGQDFLIVTPGIRESEDNDDQKRVSTVRNAIIRGADYIVVGRPIRLAGDPVRKAEEITKQISEALAIKQKVI